MEIYKLGAARIQLDSAIRLLLEGDAISSITLAGAAEELLGRMIDSPAVDEAALDLATSHGLPERIVRDQTLNGFRNWLKHNDSGSNDSIQTDLESEAIQMIGRAIVNFIRLVGNPNTEDVRFASWLKASRPEFFP